MGWTRNLERNLEIFLTRLPLSTHMSCMDRPVLFVLYRTVRPYMNGHQTQSHTYRNSIMTMAISAILDSLGSGWFRIFCFVSWHAVGQERVFGAAYRTLYMTCRCMHRRHCVAGVMHVGLSVQKASISFQLKRKACSQQQILQPPRTPKM